MEKLNTTVSAVPEMTEIACKISFQGTSGLPFVWLPVRERRFSSVKQVEEIQNELIRVRIRAKRRFKYIKNKVNIISMKIIT